MMTYAMTKGGVDHEAEIAAAKRRLEARPPLRPVEPGARRQARAANERGRSALQESRVAEAVQAFQAGYTADPTDVEIINNLGYAYLFQGDLQTAEVWLLRALVVSPGRSIAWANLGHVYAAQGNLRVAVACFAHAYRFALRKETMRKSLEILARDNENDQVREAARQALQLPLVQATTN
jgi:Flp pilus assembly protein TadD